MAHPCKYCGLECFCKDFGDDIVDVDLAESTLTPANCSGCGCNIISDDDYDFDDEFIPCDKCDGHDACADFGCAIELGLGNMVKKDIKPGYDDWG